MQTVIIWDELAGDLDFFVVDGDRSHLNDVYINQFEHESLDADTLEKYQDELNELLYTDAGAKKLIPKDEFPVEAVKQGAKVIVAGFLP